MKRTAAIITAFVIFLLSGCSGKSSEKTKPTESVYSSTSADYEKIECRKTPYDWKYVGITHGDGRTVSLYVPREWSFEKENGQSYKIMRDGNFIGTLSSEPVTASGKAYERRQSVNSGLTSYSEIQAVSGRENAFRRVFSMTYQADTVLKRVTVVTDYSELSTGAAQKLREGSTLLSDQASLRGSFELKNRSTSVAVWGNSFVGTSQVGEFLNQMFEASGSRYKAFPVSRGYAQVSTYTSDEYYMQLIESGEYCAVFQCGLYSSSEAEHLGRLKEACEKSGTLLVIFPAHNESATAINDALSRYPTISYLGWKSEIETLIGNGVPYGAMCIDDEHKHSTPLAGYVGAHMIFRALTGKVPPETEGVIGYDFQAVSSLLGDYVNSLEGAVSVRNFSEEINF